VLMWCDRKVYIIMNLLQYDIQSKLAITNLVITKICLKWKFSPIVFEYSGWLYRISLRNLVIMHIHYPTINHRILRNFTSKTYEKSFFSKISPAHVCYVNDNSSCMMLKLIDCAFWEKEQSIFISSCCVAVVRWN